MKATTKIQLGHVFITTAATLTKGFILKAGTRFTVIGRKGAGYLIRLNNKVKRELVVGRKWFATSSCVRQNRYA